MKGLTFLVYLIGTQWLSQCLLNKVVIPGAKHYAKYSVLSCHLILITSLIEVSTFIIAILYLKKQVQKG